MIKVIKLFISYVINESPISFQVSFDFLSFLFRWLHKTSECWTRLYIFLEIMQMTSWRCWNKSTQFYIRCNFGYQVYVVFFFFKPILFNQSTLGTQQSFVREVWAEKNWKQTVQLYRKSCSASQSYFSFKVRHMFHFLRSFKIITLKIVIKLPWKLKHNEKYSKWNNSFQSVCNSKVRLAQWMQPFSVAWKTSMRR